MRCSKFAAYSITSWARSRKVSGILSPEALWWLLTSMCPQRRARVVEVTGPANVVLSNGPEIDLS
jgi:hypothetical protein